MTLGERIGDNIDKNIQIVESYLNGVGTIELSEKFCVHRSTIQSILKKNGVELRKKAPKYIYNTMFFSEYNPESCYWAGFIAADGYVRSDRNTMSIKLAKTDESHLKKFADIIQFHGNVNSKEKSSSIITVSGKWFVDDLQRHFSIGPRKTFVVEIDRNIPTNLMHHFVRGYFDGDGCITYTTCPQISFVSGSINMLMQLSATFYSIGVRLKSGNEIPPVTRNVQISYSGKNAKTILDWIYNNSHLNIRLDRKYDKYINLFCG
jgi:intein-encoded DNA endonuclease-like protein